MSEDKPEATAPPPGPGKSARNERRKALATTLNGLSVALLVAVFVQLVTHQATLPIALLVIAFFVAAQGALHYISASWRIGVQQSDPMVLILALSVAAAAGTFLASWLVDRVNAYEARHRARR